MSAPIYHSNVVKISVGGTLIPACVAAIRFAKDDPTTHWHVNCGHPRIPELDGKYWVDTKDGVVEIADGDWVIVRHDADSRPQVVTAAAFDAEFEPVP